MEVFGAPISIGDYVCIIAASDLRVRLSVWSDLQVSGQIRIGDYCLICPGVRISSASQIRIGDNCMIASSAYLTDSDWHDVYNRIAFGKTDPIYIVGAGAVVANSIPANCIVAGNPARVVKHLDAEESFTTRKQWFPQTSNLYNEIDKLDRQLLGDNTLLHWLRYVFFPSKGD